MSERRRKSEAGGGKVRPSKCGVRQRIDAFIDVRRAVDAYCRKHGLVKSMKEIMDEQYERRRK